MMLHVRGETAIEHWLITLVIMTDFLADILSNKSADTKDTESDEMFYTIHSEVLHNKSLDHRFPTLVLE